MKNVKYSIPQKVRSLRKNAEQYKNGLESQTMMHKKKNELIWVHSSFYGSPNFILKIVGIFRRVFPTKIILLIFFNALLSLSEAQQVNFIKYTVHDGLVANPI